MKLKFAQNVHHAKYGWGTIVEFDGKEAVVYFRSVGIKKLAASKAVFDLIGGETHKKKVPVKKGLSVVSLAGADRRNVVEG